MNDRTDNDPISDYANTPLLNSAAVFLLVLPCFRDGLPLACPEVFGGKPIIRDLRISAELVLSPFAQGVTPEIILKDCPGPESEDLRACTAGSSRELSLRRAPCREHRPAKVYGLGFLQEPCDVVLHRAVDALLQACRAETHRCRSR